MTQRALHILAVATALATAVFAQQTPKELHVETKQTDMFKDAMTILPAGNVKPEGWLKEWALAAANGYTGHMTDVDQEFVRAWTRDFQPTGDMMNWWKGSWSFEGGAYWFDGLIRLAKQLDDKKLLKLAEARLAPVLDNMHPNAIGFCWWLDRRNPEHVAMAKEPGNWIVNWVSGMFARCLCAWYEATADPRARQALIYALGDDYWVKTFYHNRTLPSGAYEAWRVTGAPEIKNALMAFARKIQEDPRRADYGDMPWEALETSLFVHRKEERELNLRTRHGVIANESLLSLFAAYRASSDERFLKRVRAWYGFFDKHLRLPYGAMVMDEEWGAPGPLRGTETCAISAELWSRTNLLAGLGEAAWGDDVERGFFNASPNCTDRTWSTHVYFQTPNRLIANPVERLSAVPEKNCAEYARKHSPLCCTAGLNRQIPDFIQAMWMKTDDGGVAAALYGPCSLETNLDGGTLALTETTDYPFNETLDIVVRQAPTSELTIRLRMPAWCKKPVIRLNGNAVSPVCENGFAILRRQWKPGDTIALTFPMKPRVDVMRDYDHTLKEYAYVSCGPLLFVKPFAEKSDNEPAEATDLPEVDADRLVKGAKMVRTPLASPWNWPLNAPVSITAQTADGTPMTLIPYGCSKFRVAMFPIKPYMSKW